MICYSLAALLALSLRFYLQWMNARRVRVEGFVGSAGNAGAVGGGKVLDIGQSARNVAQIVNRVALVPTDYEDITDWKTPGFRYRL